MTIESLVLLLRAVEKAASDAVRDLIASRCKAIASELAISDLRLSVRARNVLKRMNVASVLQLTEVSCNDLVANHIGVTTLNEIRERLSENGLSLRGEEDAIR